MIFGSLLVKMPDGRELEFPVNKPQVLVGRSPDNDLVISHVTISRRHARFKFEPDQIILEDLGSTNGTFTDSEQLAPLQPVSISSDQDIFLGEVIILYRSSEQLDGDHLQTNDKAVTPVIDPNINYNLEQLVSLSIECPFEPVTPGSTTSAIISLHNISPSNQEYLIRVSGLPSNWFRLSNDRLKLGVNASENIRLYFHPPRLPEVNPGDHQFKVTIYSSEYGRGPSTEGNLKVKPFFNFNLTLEPEKSNGEFTLVAHNQSNVSLNYRFNGYGIEKKLLFEFQQSSINLEAGQKARIPVSITSQSRAFFGHNQITSFRIIADPTTDDIGETITEGQMIIHPTIRVWSASVSVTLLMVMILIVTFSFTRICQNFPMTMSFCPSISPSIQYFAAEPLEVQLGETVLIKWDVDHAKKVELIAPVLNLNVQVPQNGSEEFFLAQSTRFTIRAANGTDTHDQSIFVKVIGTPPTIQTFFADPGAIVLGQVENLILNWSVLDADKVIIDGVSDELLPSEGKLEITYPKEDTVFTLIADNEIGKNIQELTVYVISPGCVVKKISNGESLGLYVGPSKNHPLLAKLEPDTIIEPFGRTATGDWLLVRTAHQQGWLPTEFISCTVGVHIFPTLLYQDIPTPPPLEPTPKSQ